MHGIKKLLMFLRDAHLYACRCRNPFVCTFSLGSELTIFSEEQVHFGSAAAAW